MSAQLKIAKFQALGMQGDPGLGDWIRRGLGKVANFFTPAPIKAAAAVGRRIAPGALVNRPPSWLTGVASQKTMENAFRDDARSRSIQPQLRDINMTMIGPGQGIPSGRFFGRKKYRRMNPLNPKALRRSIKRVGRFQDFARDVGFTRAPAKFKGVHEHKHKR